ncbi:AraC family transcriptional regulator [Haloechinothrix sp. LS1_15]|uniref:AraC family transcriptional regulator n=1 Tax=Haloechinothrix sp. LS1_15 TaxID=2652248 RepID=UPI0029452F1B|nr:AraC family transcriptional regulator [Haloechinothrix sp. LS1_15]MDV6011733.1 AraC family transcriptional regulator [Haloechinothrix sp. LS1_15]
MAELPQPVVGQWDFPRSAASVLLMVKFAAEHGVAAHHLLRRTEMTGRTLTDPEVQIGAEQELTVIRNLVETLGHRPALGIELGRRYRVSTFGVFGFACVSSPTLRDALAFALRYLDLSFTFCIPTVSEVDGRFRLQLHDERVPEDVRWFLVQRDLTAIYTVGCDLLGSTLPLAGLELRDQQRAGPEPFIEAFGVVPALGSARNAFAAERHYLDRPLPQANEHTVALCEAQCRELVTRRRRRSGVAEQVRDRLTKLGAITAGIEVVASELHMSERTLRRKLAEEGTSYRALLDEVRQALAEELLATGALSVSDVAIRLGYAEATSFIYAFRRWRGETPAAYRRRVRRGRC